MTETNNPSGSPVPEPEGEESASQQLEERAGPTESDDDIEASADLTLAGVSDEDSEAPDTDTGTEESEQEEWDETISGPASKFRTTKSVRDADRDNLNIYVSKETKNEFSTLVKRIQLAYEEEYGDSLVQGHHITEPVMKTALENQEDLYRMLGIEDHL